MTSGTERGGTANYLPELDGLRALSVLIVITVHLHDATWEWLAGAKGVTVFFILSGYLITSLALREEKDRGAVSLPAFYVRRTFRIFPLYYLTLGLYALLILGLGVRPDKRANFLLALPYDLVYLQEVPFYGGIGVADNIPLYHTWSLGIEEKFYLVWPLLCFVLLRGRANLRLGVALGLAAVFAGAANFGRVLGPCLFSYFHILLGCALALLLDRPAARARMQFMGSPLATVATTAAFLAIHFVWPRYSAWPFNPWIDVPYSVVAAVFMLSVLLGRGALQRVLGARPLCFIGRLSYGIYLIHVLCVNAVEKVLQRLSHGVPGLGWSVAKFVLAAAVSVTVAWGLHVAVEKPLIAVGRRWSRRILSRDRPGDPALTAVRSA